MFSSYYTSSRSIASFMYKVYAWMSGALALTGMTAYAVFATPSIFMALMTNKILFYGLIFGQIGLVIALAALINRISFAGAAALFVAYSMTLGITLSTIFAVYQIQSIGMVFCLTAGLFLTMALYGYFTGADLTSVGNLLGMLLLGVIIASLINMFVGSQTFDYILSFAVVIIFTGLTAYDVQKIKYQAHQMMGQGQAENKVALLGALTLYLDFINLFMALLHLLGKRRD